MNWSTEWGKPDIVQAASEMLKQSNEFAPEFVDIQDATMDWPKASIKLGNKTISVIVVGDLGLDFCEPGEKDEGWNIYHLPTLQSVSSAVPPDVLDFYNYDKPELLRWMAKVQTNYPTSWEVLRVLTPDDYHDKGTINKEIIKKWCLSVKVE